MPNVRIGDVYVARAPRVGSWCTLQVVEVSDRVIVAALSALSEQKPTPETLPPLVPFMCSYYHFSDSPELPMCAVLPEALEQAAELVGNVEPMDVSKDRFRRRPWKYDVDELVYDREVQHLWDTLPEADRRRFEHRDRYLGEGRAAVQHARDTPLVRELTLRSTDEPVVSIEETSVRELSLDIAGVREIRLSKFTSRLTLRGPTDEFGALRIAHPLGGQGLTLGIHDYRSRPLPDFRLPRLSKLLLHGVDTLDLEAVRHYSKLRELSLWGNPGTLDNVHALGALAELSELLLSDLFGFSAAEFPESGRLPRLRSLVLKSVPKEAGATLKKRYVHIENLDIGKLRAPEWMTQNLNNPFRSWDGRKHIRPADAKTAFQAYLAARKRIDKLSKAAHTEEHVAPILEAFVTTLNRVAKKSALETMERDEAVTAFRSLLASTSVPPAAGDRWWEAWEDF